MAGQSKYSSEVLLKIYSVTSLLSCICYFVGGYFYIQRPGSQPGLCSSLTFYGSLLLQDCRPPLPTEAAERRNHINPVQHYPKQVLQV